MLILFAVLIGIYYHYAGRKKKTLNEYMFGSHSMSLWPVAFSLMASFMSAITLLGVPAEIYMYGTQFLAINLSYALATPICAYVFLPVFYEMKATSTYEVSTKRAKSVAFIFNILT